MSKFVWYLKQLLPLTYWSTYQEVNGEVRTYLSIWRMWFGIVFDSTTVEVSGFQLKEKK